MQPDLKVTMTGPFFERDPAATFLHNVGKMMEAVAEEGQEGIRPKYPVYTGAGQAGVIGRVKALNGKPWLATAVISEQHVYPWPGGGPKRYRGGKAEASHHMFRDETRALNSSRAVRYANLTEGIE